MTLLLLAACAADWLPDEGGGPEVYLVAPVEGQTGAGPVRVEGLVVDDRHPPEALVVAVWADGALARTATVGAGGRLDTELVLDPGAHVVVVEATDPDGAVGRAEVGLWVDDGATLPAPRLSLTPAAPVTGDALAGVLEGQAPRGATAVWAWERDGAPTDHHAESVPAGAARDGETWTARVYWVTGGSWSTEAEASVAVGNAAPDPGGLALAPDPATTRDALRCVHDPAVDPEGDPFTLAYAWTLDGAPLDEVGPELAAGLAVRGQTVGCAVVLDDGEPHVHAAAPLVIANAPPTVGAVTVTPDAATEATTLACAGADLTDPDGDVVTATYRWLVGGQEVGWGPTVTGAGFDRGDAVRCELTPRDPYGPGVPTLSAPVVIANTPPEAPEVGFTAAEIVPGDLATCAITRPALDVDGDRVSYAWSWEVDGAAVAGDTSSFDTAGLVPGATLTCLAAGVDAVSTGPTGAASVVLGG